MKDRNLLWWGAIALVLALSSPFVLFVFFYVLRAGTNEYGNPGDNFGFPNELAALGDSFGVANVIVSGFAFLALLWTLRQQNESLEQQQKDVKINQEHLSQSIAEMAQANESTERMAKAQEQANLLQFTELAVRLDEEIRKHWEDPIPLRGERAWLDEHCQLLLGLFQVCGSISHSSAVMHDARLALGWLPDLLNLYVEVFDRAEVGASGEIVWDDASPEERMELAAITARIIVKRGAVSRISKNGLVNESHILGTIRQVMVEIEHRLRFTFFSNPLDRFHRGYQEVASVEESMRMLRRASGGC